MEPARRWPCCWLSRGRYRGIGQESSVEKAIDASLSDGRSAADDEAVKSVIGEFVERSSTPWLTIANTGDAKKGDRSFTGRGRTEDCIASVLEMRIQLLTRRETSRRRSRNWSTTSI